MAKATWTDEHGRPADLKIEFHWAKDVRALTGHMVKYIKPTAKDHLRQAIRDPKNQKVANNGKTWTLNVTGKAEAYAQIRDVGGMIRERPLVNNRPRLMHWQDGGKDIFAYRAAGFSVQGSDYTVKGFADWMDDKSRDPGGTGAKGLSVTWAKK